MRRNKAKEYALEHGVTERTAYRRLAGGGPGHARIPQAKVDRVLELADDEVPVPMIALDVGLEAERVRHLLRRFGRHAEPEWARIRVTITNNPALRALHEEIMK